MVYQINRLNHFTYVRIEYLDHAGATCAISKLRLIIVRL